MPVSPVLQQWKFLSNGLLDIQGLLKPQGCVIGPSYADQAFPKVIKPSASYSCQP